MTAPQIVRKPTGHGGWRPGSGRKNANTTKFQTTMRGIFEECVSPEDWRLIVDAAVELAKKGDRNAREWLTPWIVGKQPDTILHGADADNPMRMVIEVEYVGSIAARGGNFIDGEFTESIESDEDSLAIAETASEAVADS
jgi:hypothetical protein